MATTSTPRLQVRGSDGSKISRLSDNEEEALSREDDVSPVVSDAGGQVNIGPRSGHRRRKAVERLEQAGVETSTQSVSLGLKNAKKRSRV